MVELEKHQGSGSKSKLKQKLRTVRTVRTLTKDQKDKTNSWQEMEMQLSPVMGSRGV